MLSPEEYNRIERMRKNLYSRRSPPPADDVRTPISKPEYDVKDDWVHEEKHFEDMPQRPKKAPGSFFRKLLIISLIFFVACAGLALFIFYGGFNIISSNNVDIQVAGPISVAGGEVLPLEITVLNKNNTDLDYANLMVEYPDGTRSVSDINTELTRENDDLGVIAAGQSSKTIVQSLLFGQQNTQETIKITVEYKVKGSNSSFFKEKDYQILLTTAPVTLGVDTLTEATADQNFDTTLTITSNSNTPLTNLLVTAQYPFGFDFVKATPTPDFDNQVWVIPSLKPGEVKTIKLTGRIEGEDGEQRTLTFAVGTQDPNDQKSIKTSFVTSQQSIALQKPFVGLDLTLNGDTTDSYVLGSSGRVTGSINWTNNLATVISDAEIDLTINGNVLDLGSITADGGFFSSANDTISWDKRGDSDLESLQPGATGKVQFSFATLPNLRSVHNPSVTLDVSVKGTRASETNVPEAITSSITRNVKVATALDISARTVYSSGPFKNTGTIPPHVNKPTTYTVIWSLTNSLNDVTDATIVAVLPPYVKWLNVVASSTEQVVYDSEKNEVIWQAGQVVAGAGITTPVRQAVFQLQFLPSVSQIGATPTLTGEVDVGATDTYTNTSVTASTPGSDITLPTDPAYGKSASTAVEP